MDRNVRVQVADASGNVTIFVLDQFTREQYQTVATQLLAMEELGGEQVAFVTGENSMEMCGLEFCGNASRSFGLMVAKGQNLQGTGKMIISVSGCDELLGVDVDPANNYTRIKMPKPLSITTLTDMSVPFLEGASLVDLGGIMHVILMNVEPNQENFDLVKDYINETYNPPAMGAMFYDTEKDLLSPVVYVRDVDTTYFEGSCGSGSTAVAAAFSAEEKSGTFQFELQQPAGKIISTIEKAHGDIKNVWIQGPVFLDDVTEVTLSLPEQ
ncbi:MAG: hypothetical protein IKU44_05485 [Firmicutes bacterium]|nr:hypothetical protein [Bacillota bacterium]